MKRLLVANKLIHIDLIEVKKMLITKSKKSKRKLDSVDVFLLNNLTRIKKKRE